MAQRVYCVIIIGYLHRCLPSDEMAIKREQII